MGGIVSIDKMKIGHKGVGKHWTKAQVDARRKAAEKVTRKKPARLNMPDWLDESAQAVWKKTLRAMKGFDVLDLADSDLLAIYCDAIARQNVAAKSAVELLEAHPITATELMKAAQGYSRIALTYAEKLGLTPNARARLAKKIGEKKEDPNSDLFD
jgi:P27 family predicted phage terminase small subunit